MSEKIHIRVDRSFASFGLEVYVFAPCDNGRDVGVINMKPAEAHAYTPPTTFLQESEAQELMDDLWRAGIRPTEGAGTAGSLRAVESHLKDMRLIVGKKLGIEW